MSDSTNSSASDLPTSSADADLLIDQITRDMRSQSAQVVPWFLGTMPATYFQDTDQATQLVHLQAIIAARASGRPIEMTLRSEDGSQWTSMRPLDYPGVLAELVSELPTDQPLRAAKIHTAHDGTLVIDTFEFGDNPRCDLTDPAQQTKRNEFLEYAGSDMEDWTPAALDKFLCRCGADYVLTLTPLRLAKHWEMFKEVTDTDGTVITLEPEADPSQSRISIAVGNSTRRTMLERVADRFSRSNINIHRAYLDTIEDGNNGSISLLGFVVQVNDGPIDPDGVLWAQVKHDLERIKWVHQRTIELSRRHDQIDLTHAELFDALCELVHHKLVHRNRHAFTSERIRRLAEENIELSMAVADLFLERFNPEHPMDDRRFREHAETLEDRLMDEVDLEDSRTILTAMLKAVACVLRTNIYVHGRYGLAMRLDPTFLQNDERPELPFGVFFVHGRGASGFHVRFRDISRGGIRAVTPRSLAQYTRECERLYDEAYGLAQAQQLKNKDIPEGGSKAAVLVEPGARMDRAVKGFVDSLLDLITPDKDIRARIIDRLGEDELIYLGPDENITPKHIDWIVDRAQRRGYPVPTALMSSKPGAGINHKEYGVTSEGVAVFLDVGLKHLGIDPREQSFTVKITGGPDGDVGGNLIRILIRDFGSNVRFVGIADGSGSGECPDGLDHDELLRLVKEALPITAFNPDKLSGSGRITGLDEPDGVRLRNTLHNRVVADAFVPCGGRPATIHSRNWKEFLRPDGTSSSRIVVEGANLFLTPTARDELSRVGTLIFKDSSANKCGVICSSYEIIASMLLTEQEFLNIKPQFVPEVLDKLRGFARREAQLLVRLHRQQADVLLPEMSIRLSRSVIRTADSIEPTISGLSGEDREIIFNVIRDHLPRSLVEIAQDRLDSHLPPAYLKWMVAKSLAARLVYREGVDPLEKMSTATICELALDFLRMEQERKELVAELDDSSLPHHERIAAILRQTGILSTLQDDIEDSET